MKYFLFLLFSAVWLMLGNKLLLGYGLGSASKTLGYCMEVAVGKKTSGDHWSVTGHMRYSTCPSTSLACTPLHKSEHKSEAIVQY